MSKPIDNRDNGSYAAGEPRTQHFCIAQISWREPGDTQDSATTIKVNSPGELGEKIAHYRFLRGSYDRFNVVAWSESLRLSDGHWKLVEKHDLSVRDVVAHGEADAK